MSINRIIQQAASNTGPSFEFQEGVTQIGDAIDGGFFAGIIDTTQSNIEAGDDYQSGLRYALIVGPRSIEIQPSSVAWDAEVRAGQTGSITRWNGLGSTDNILAKNDTDYEIFEVIRSTRISSPVPDDGGSDWYMPALDELELCYRNFKPQGSPNIVGDEDTSDGFPKLQDYGYNPSSDPQGSAYTSGSPSQTSVTIFQQGNSESFDTAEADGYWTSSDADNFANAAFLQHFLLDNNYGVQRAVAKGNGNSHVRLVRRLPLD